MIIVHRFYVLISVFAMGSFSAYRLWGLPTIDLSSDLFLGMVHMHVPLVVMLMRVAMPFMWWVSKTYPICCNEHLSGGPDGTIHDWDEVHCCRHCGHEYWFRNGCF